MATVPTQQARLTWPSSSPTPGPAFLLYAISIFLGSRSAKFFVFRHFIVGICAIVCFKVFVWLGRDRQGTGLTRVPGVQLWGEPAPPSSMPCRPPPPAPHLQGEAPHCLVSPGVSLLLRLSLGDIFTEPEACVP